MNELKTYTFHVSGTHCSACKHLIEDALADASDFSNPNVSLKNETLTISTDTTGDEKLIAAKLTEYIREYGYEVHTEAVQKIRHPKEWFYAGVATVIALLGFILLERAGLTSLIGEGGGNLTTAFVVGLVASVSTCLAVVGGLVLSVSATYAHEGRGWRPQAYFHVGRIVGFFILGGLLGLLGEVMQIGFYGTAILGALASIVMLILGIHLLDITKKVRLFTLPKGISRFFTDAAHKAGIFAPVLLGAVTFFLPCGFTQSMQIVALSSGSFATGALTMLVFALGTLPVLALLSFGSLDLAKSRFRGVFFKAAGMVVILFAIFNLYSTLRIFGIISSTLSF